MEKEPEKEWIYVYIYITEPLCCTPETHCKSTIPQYKIKIKL